MALPPGFLDELRTRVPVSDVVGRRVSWDARKSNPARGDFWACCPFHQEKSPSFHVDDRRGFYHCFGCGAKGDAITFLREADNLPFMEAVAELARLAGVALPAPDPEAARRAERRRGLTDWMEAAVAFFRAQLSAAGGGEARAYLRGRGLTQSALDRFEIGYAPPDRQALLRWLGERGAPVAQIVEAGLVAEPEGGGAPYDRFRDRIMFPIRDPRGACIAFGGRAMAKDARAKYLNSPQTPLFDKSRTLYNLGPARAAAGRSGALVVAEGYMDVIALVGAGVEHAVAPLGTAITAEHLAMLWRAADAPVLALDGDAAGLDAARRAVDLAVPLLRPGKTLRVALMPAGRDPDDVVRAEGPEAMRRLLDDTTSIVDLLWRRETEGRRFDDPDARAALEKRLRDALARFEDPTVRAHYDRAFFEKRRALFSAPRPDAPPPGRAGPARAARGRWGAPPGVTRETRASALARGDGAAGAARAREAAILCALSRHPRLVERFAEDLAAVSFASPDLDDCRRRLAAAQDATEAAAALAAVDAVGAATLGFAAARADAATAAAGVAEALALMAAEAMRRREVEEAESALLEDDDPALARRLAAALTAFHRESRGAPIETGRDEAHLSESLEAAISNEIWKKRPRGGG